MIVVARQDAGFVVEAGLPARTGVARPAAAIAETAAFARAIRRAMPADAWRPAPAARVRRLAAGRPAQVAGVGLAEHAQPLAMSGVADALTALRAWRENGGAELGAIAGAHPGRAAVLAVPMMAAFGLARAGDGGERAADQAREGAATGRGLTEATGQSVKRLRVHGRTSYQFDASALIIPPSRCLATSMSRHIAAKKKRRAVLDAVFKRRAQQARLLRQRALKRALGK